MHDKALAALIDRTKAIGEEMVYLSPLPNAGAKIVGGEHATSAFAFSDKGGELLRTLVREELLQKRGWSDRFSEEYIRKRLTSIFHQVREERSLSPIEAGVKQLISEYESFDEEYFVIVPLVLNQA